MILALFIISFACLHSSNAYGLENRVLTKKYDWELDTSKMIAKSSFKIKPNALIARCKEVIDSEIGIKNPNDLASDFVFQFPIIGPLSKDEYIKAVSGFGIKTMFPDLNTGHHVSC